MRTVAKFSGSYSEPLQFCSHVKTAYGHHVGTVSKV
jgi:hypothetical protein